MHVVLTPPEISSLQFERYFDKQRAVCCRLTSTRAKQLLRPITPVQFIFSNCSISRSAPESVRSDIRGKPLEKINYLKT